MGLIRLAILGLVLFLCWRRRDAVVLTRVVYVSFVLVLLAHAIYAW